MAKGDFPLPKFHYKVTMNNVVISFKEVSGLNQEIEKMEYRGGEEPFYSRKRSGLVKSSPVTFKKGIFNKDKALTNVINTNTDFSKYYAVGTLFETQINLLNEKGETVVTWKLHDCIPTKMSFSDFASDSSEISIEEIELDYTNMEYTFA